MPSTFAQWRVASKNFFVGGADRRSFALLQYVEDQVVAIGLGNAQAGGQRGGIFHISAEAFLHPKL